MADMDVDMDIDMDLDLGPDPEAAALEADSMRLVRLTLCSFTSCNISDLV